MRLLNCPKPEHLLEYISIPTEMRSLSRLKMSIHLVTCASCKVARTTLERSIDQYFAIKPDITSSLIRVYSRLQNDETLILKGWKLGELTKSPPMSSRLLSGGWLFRGGVTLALGSLIVLFLTTQLSGNRDQAIVNEASAKVPYAQIRFEDKNRVKIHYVKPELLQSIEFETTSNP